MPVLVLSSAGKKELSRVLQIRSAVHLFALVSYYENHREPDIKGFLGCESLIVILK